MVKELLESIIAAQPPAVQEQATKVIQQHSQVRSVLFCAKPVTVITCPIGSLVNNFAQICLQLSSTSYFPNL